MELGPAPDRSRTCLQFEQQQQNVLTLFDLPMQETKLQQMWGMEHLEKHQTRARPSRSAPRRQLNPLRRQGEQRQGVPCAGVSACVVHGVRAVGSTSMLPG
jgi:hypothetical protein